MIEVVEEKQVTQRVLKSSRGWVCPHCDKNPQEDDGIAHIAISLHYSKQPSIEWTCVNCGEKLECSVERVTYNISKTLH